MNTVIVAIVAAVLVATLAGWLLTRRSGNIREVHSDAGVDAADLGLSHDGPTVVHFSAPWCGPCDRVRRVVDQVCDDLGDLGFIAHVEVDLDANPQAASRFSVLSLPTTLIFDIDGRQRYRTSGVPKAAELRSALEPLLA
ncbi:thiol reductase thioredoxin [Mycobacterium sp. IS-836]|uniref:thioredoxin family protein n=1 Tax=Mycobacterium sp. IS-836 TaxID=1834160 RepID=UPI00096EE7D5|nr:thioredoxin family protein [Mycobacterium sp. IS-836]OMC56859.1 thiol reductase thioredoxin [Mycobacterium sp. IS-836]